MPSKWMKQSLQHKFEEHRRRVREARSTIDKGKPPDMPMSMRRETERRRQQSAIELDNRLLLDRLGEAMSRKNIDNELVPQHFVSYLELQRKKELIKITRENQRLLHRIQHSVPTYHPEEWEKEKQRHEEHLRNMTEFPELFVLPGQRPMVSTIDGAPNRFTDKLGGGLTLTGPPNNTAPLLLTAPQYTTRRSGQNNTANAALRKTMSSSSRSPTQQEQHQQHYHHYQQQQGEVDDALAETEAMFRQAFQLHANPQPPPNPPFLPANAYNSSQNHQNNNNYNNSQHFEDEEEDFSKNQVISRPFLPDIRQPTSAQTPPPGALRRR